MLLTLRLFWYFRHNVQVFFNNRLLQSWRPFPLLTQSSSKMASVNSGTGDKNYNGGQETPTPPQVGSKRRRAPDNFKIAQYQPSDDEESTRIDLYDPDPTPTPVGTADTHTQLQLYRGPDVNSFEAAC